MTPKIILLLLSVVLAIHCNCQDEDIFKPDSVKRKIEGHQIITSLRIDGLLNEPEWKLTKASPRFIQIEPYQGQAPR